MIRVHAGVQVGEVVGSFKDKGKIRHIIIQLSMNLGRERPQLGKVAQRYLILSNNSYPKENSPALQYYHSRQKEPRSTAQVKHAKPHRRCRQHRVAESTADTKTSLFMCGEFPHEVDF